MSLRSRMSAALHHLPWPLSVVAHRVFLRRHERVYNVEVLPGVRVVLSVPKHSGLWERRLAQPGGHERGVCEWLQKSLQADDVFFDIGAHFGFYMALVSALQPTVGIHGFEPANGLSHFLRSTRDRCPAGGRWVLQKKFVGDEMNAKSLTLDGYCEAVGLSPTIVKADVEGAEIFVLRGARRLIERRQTTFLIEVHPRELKKLGASIDEVLACFPADYELRVLDDFRENVESSWSNNVNLANQADQTYLYAAPKPLARGVPAVG